MQLTQDAPIGLNGEFVVVLKDPKSYRFSRGKRILNYEDLRPRDERHTDVAELVDAHGLGPCGEIRGGSIPLIRTSSG